ncbi:MAG: helix-turn-helix domain-containing protein [Polymorphobacter sp.]|uniref:helix-turn-helix domain-containing protein n=1 Tax=Polymorphobacter sp. TaxID=1909290 RepID=UPI003A896C00
MDRELARSRLPQRAEEMADLYVNVVLGTEWLVRVGHDLEPMELGLLGAPRAGIACLWPVHQTAILTAASGIARLQALAEVVRAESSSLELSLHTEGNSARVICDMPGFWGRPNHCLAEWLNLQSVISIMQSVAGPTWSPIEMGFVSACRIPEAVQAAFPDTRIRMGRPCTSLVVDMADLVRPCAAPQSADKAFDMLELEMGAAAPVEAWTFVSLMRNLIQAYLSDRRLDIDQAAEIAGMSTRTLQRKLTMSGTSFSQLCQEARFDLACRSLANGDLKIIDVAMMVGYQTPQHFARAFRKFAGVSPSRYRRNMTSPGFAAGFHA